jgi:DNA polymerase III epsilon subunit-like protein
MKALIFDFETTGIPKHPEAKKEAQPRVIEFGGVLVDRSGKELQTLELLIDPQTPLEPIITKITGLTDDDLDGQPMFIEVEPQLRRLFAAADVMIAHNLPFDSTMLKLELDRHSIADWPWPVRSVCTVQEHAEEWGKRPKLTELYEHYTGTPLQQTHRAIDDVRALLTCCIKSGILSQ